MPAGLFALVALIFGSIVSVRAETVEFKGCHARWSENELVIGNSLIERKWKIDQGLLTSISFRDLENDSEWLRQPGRQPAPHPGGEVAAEARTVSFTTRSGKSSPVEEESLIVEMAARGKAASFAYRFQIFPKASGVTILFTAESPEVKVEVVNAPGKDDAPKGLESADGGKAKLSKAIPALEDVVLAPYHLRFTQVELLDQSDGRNELVFEKEWLPTKETVEVSGNVFFSEDVTTGRGLVFLKLAPLPHARPVLSDWDARAAEGGRRLTFAGHGYPYVLLAYSGGSLGRIAALHTYQRQLRAYHPNRDGLLLSNTWGDRSADGRVSEEFVLKEIDAGSRLGVDVVQIDDGWQKGMSGNSAFGKGAWGKFYAADPDFWQPHPLRFPRGLKPLVEAAAAKKMRLGIWFAPESQDDNMHWEHDADLVLDNFRNHGVAHVKIDAAEIPTRKAEANLQRFYDKLLRETDGRVTFDADATAGRRLTYFGSPGVGPVFVENRYTDWTNYWPHLTLRNLWKLSHYVDPLRLRMEFLNNTRNAAKYGEDPLAPARYSPDALFATVMFSSPLAWFEVSNLPSAYQESVSMLVKVWKAHREEIFSGQMLPVGSAPDGGSWTGFVSTSQDRKSAHVLVFRELNPAADWTLELPFLSGENHRVTVLAGKGEAALSGNSLNLRLREKLQYLWLRVESGDSK